MIKRDTPRDTDRPNMVSVDLPNGMHHFRLPSMLTVAKILKSAGAKNTVGLLALGALIKAGNPQAAIQTLKESGAEGLSMMGALIGVSWYHAHKDLEAVRGENLLAYGEAVYEELHGEGYDPVKIMLLTGFLTTAIAETIEFDKEVADRLGFTVPEKEPETSSPSTSK